jgi:pimeloyl-ACP methyl ester carboxylesterase
MKKAFKIIGKVVLGLLILLAVFLIVMTIYNQIMLRKNKDLYGTPLGQLVEVDGHNMSIYTEGEGEHTIVFMSGWGTTSPILDFKCLYSRLSDENKIVVVEKFGYGFSDIVEGERDFDTILRQDREALQKADIKAPYILCAHSYSGYEAVLCAQKYPDEV